MPLFTAPSRLSRRLDRDYAMAADVLGDVRAAWLERFPNEQPEDFHLELRAPIRHQCLYSFGEEAGGAPLRFRAGQRQVYVTIAEGSEPIVETYDEATTPPSEARLAVQHCKQRFLHAFPTERRRLVIARLHLASARPRATGEFSARFTGTALADGPFRFEVLRDGAPFGTIDFAFHPASVNVACVTHAPPTPELLKSVGIDSDRVASRYAGLLCRAARDALAGWSREGVDPVSIGLYCPFSGILQDQALLDLLDGDGEPIENRYRMRIPPLRHLRRASYVQAAWVSIQNDIRGPTHTFVHETEGLAQALDQAWADLDTGLVKHALVAGAVANVDSESGSERAVAALIHGAEHGPAERRALERELLAFFQTGERIEP